MKFQLAAAELSHLSQVSSQELFDYAVNRLIEWEEVWSLGNENGWRIDDVNGSESIVIWPYRQLAEKYASETADRSTPLSTSLDNFLYRILGDCQAANIYISVSPVKGVSGKHISAYDLRGILEGMVETGEYYLEG
jgi:hypothetical protein